MFLTFYISIASQINSCGEHSYNTLKGNSALADTHFGQDFILYLLFLESSHKTS